LPWLNSYRFFQQNAERWEVHLQFFFFVWCALRTLLIHPLFFFLLLLFRQAVSNKQFTFDDAAYCGSKNIMDQWILTFTQSLIRFMHQEMQGRHTPALFALSRSLRVHACHSSSSSSSNSNFPCATVSVSSVPAVHGDPQDAQVCGQPDQLVCPTNVLHQQQSPCSSLLCS
jgi:hypothetical protein